MPVAVTSPSSPAVDQSVLVNRLPRATYRIQLRTDFGFDALRGLIEYLGALGISDLYLSPLFRARQDSQHGYDVVDHNRIEPAFGDLSSLRALSAAAHKAGMGVLLDIVPNHMGINDPANAYWNDVLENGPTARSALFFDIDWHPPGTDFPDRVLLPFLGRPFGAALEAGELQVQRDGDGFVLAYFDRRFPLTPHSWTSLLQAAAERLPESIASAARDELLSIITQLKRFLLDAEHVDERYREQAVVRRRLQQLQQSDPLICDAIDAAIIQLNGQPGTPHSFDALEMLLNKQYYRLAFWQVAVDEINYRRFFDINDLAAIRVEERVVFEAVHRLTFELLQAGVVTGLRIDHPDGLLDPSEYFKQLQAAFHKCQPDLAGQSLYVVAEKILSGEEALPQDWAISGTTGYEFLNQVSGVLVDGSGVEQLQGFYGEITGVEQHPRDAAYRGKMTILHDAMASELFVLASSLFRIARADRQTRDFTLPVLSRALQEWIACFSVYRTYTKPYGWEVTSEDHGRIREATRWAKLRNPTMSWSALDFVANVLLLEFPPDLKEELKTQWRQLAVRLQQVTGPATAKGIEDTAFYRYFPLVSLNEVGADLGTTGSDPAAFHRQMQRRSMDWPRAMSTTATHDTKRGEDVRARLHVLSEMAETYAQAFRLWDQEVRPLAKGLEEKQAPDANSRYFIHQSLLGSWPSTDEAEMGSPAFLDAYKTRMLAYFEKAFREAKQHTSWRIPSASYESATRDFVASVLSDPTQERFRMIHTLAGRIAGPGYINALSQVVLKTTLPGLPDFYQGNEFWDFHLVDPDNRQPVDFPSRITAAGDIQQRFNGDATALIRALREDWSDQLKMFTTMRALSTRREHWAVFASGDYQPLQVSGKCAAHVLAFSRRYGEKWIVVVVPRLPLSLLDGADTATSADAESKLQDYLGCVWADTVVQLPDDAPHRFHESFTNCPCTAAQGRLSLASVFDEFCFCILTS